jgi:hypothetical protein
VQGLTFVGTENWFSSEHKRAITAYLVEGFISAWRENLELGLARKLGTRLGEKNIKKRTIRENPNNPW